MSLELDNVEKLYRYDPFSGRFSIPVEDIPYFYVPFDELMNHTVVESVLLEEFKKENIGGFYGIIGKSGSGKSSVLNYILSETSQTKSKIFCVKINVFFDDLNGPRDFLKHIIKQIYINSTQFVKLDENEEKQARKMLAKEYSYTSEERKSVKFVLKAWFNVIPVILGLSGEVSGELQRQTGVEITEETTVNDLIGYINQMIEFLQEKTSIEHVIIMLDETDKIRKSGSSEISSDQAILFFQDIIPKLANTKCSYIFVLNSQYKNQKFKESILDPYFTATLEIPSITTQKSMIKIIEKRTQAICGDINLEKAWDEGCMDLLFEYFENESLRQLMPACRISVEKARSGGSETVSVTHVRHALVDETEN